MKFKFIVLPSTRKGQWFWRAISRNGKIVAGSQDIYKHRSHALKMAKAMAAGRPVYIKVGDKLIAA